MTLDLFLLFTTTTNHRILHHNVHDTVHHSIIIKLDRDTKPAPSPGLMSLLARLFNPPRCDLQSCKNELGCPVSLICLPTHQHPHAKDYSQLSMCRPPQPIRTQTEAGAAPFRSEY